MIKKKCNILLIGPFPKPITGNSIANKMVFQGLHKKPNIKVDIINSATSFFDEKVGFFSFKKLINSIRFNFEAYKILQSNVVYITPGQTFFGILKYSFLIFTAKVLRKRIVIHIHGNYLKEEYNTINKLKKITVKNILALADAGIVLSESLKPNLTPFLKNDDIKIVYNFVEDYLLKGTKTLIGSKELKTLKIIYLSNLMLEKGILDLLKAFQILENEGFKFEAKLAGNIDKTSKDKIKRHFDKLSNVTYLGVVEGKNKKELLLWGNIFVFPTYYKMEGQPIALLEAMATGNIILVTDHSGISDVFSTKNGLFIDKQNPSDIVNKIKIIQKNKTKFEVIMMHNHMYASCNFTSKKFINDIEKVIKPN